MPNCRTLIVVTRHGVCPDDARYTEMPEVMRAKLACLHRVAREICIDCCAPNSTTWGHRVARLWTESVDGRDPCPEFCREHGLPEPRQIGSGL